VTLRRLSHATQRQALSTIIQILSLIPDPKKEPYFRKFLRTSDACKDLPTIIANAFVKGTTWKRPSGPGYHCALISHMLLWCDPRLGNDGKASVDAEVRAILGTALGDMIEGPGSERFNSEPLQVVEMQRLLRLLRAIESMPGARLVDSTRGYLEGLTVEVCNGDLCGEEAELSCSKCKTTRYCGKKCQSWHWKNGHKWRCYATEY
jgi:hypothetical protein